MTDLQLSPIKEQSEGQKTQPVPPQPPTSAQIFQSIKKFPITQILNGVEVTYSILSKKQQTFIMSNDRFLFLKGMESISYARQISPNIQLPFKDITQVPKLKATVPLGDIQNFDTDQSKLIINFSGPKKIRWEFACPSNVCANNWKLRIKEATESLAEYKNSGTKTLEQYLKWKQNKAQMEKNVNQSQLYKMFGNNETRPQDRSTFLLPDFSSQNQQQLQTSIFSQKQGLNTTNNGKNVNEFPRTNSYYVNQQSNLRSNQSNINQQNVQNSKLSQQNSNQAINSLQQTNKQGGLIQQNSNQYVQPFQQFKPDNNAVNNSKMNTPGAKSDIRSNQAQQNSEPIIQGNQSNQTSQLNQGSKVNQGSQGNQFNQGNQGNQGGQFNQGNQSNQTSQFNQGNQGNQVNQLNQGNQVNQLNQGNQGSQFNQGNQGSQFNQGYQSNQGSQFNQGGNQNYQGNQQITNFNNQNSVNSSNLNKSATQPNSLQSGNLATQNAHNSIGNIDIGGNLGTSTSGYNLPAQIKPNNPTTSGLRTTEIANVQNFIIDRGNQNPSHDVFLNKSMSSITLTGKDHIKRQISQARRNWIEQLVGGQEECQLIIDFRNYIQKVSSVIINQLYISQDQRIFPAHQISKDYSSYLLDDVYIELYFYSQDNIYENHVKYNNSLLQFRNLDYLLSSTKNESIIKVPLTMMFEFKGFLGMAKTRVGDSSRFNNRELYELIDQRDFQQNTRVSSQVLINEAKCKIVAYEKQNNLNGGLNNFNKPQSRKTYFVERLGEFLPVDERGNNVKQHKVIRPELLQDELFDGVVFRDRNKPIKQERLTQILEQRQALLVNLLQNEEEYFTNSQQLAELINTHGMNLSQIGYLYTKCKQTWLKKILQAEMIAYCLKNFFRFDVQNSVLSVSDQNVKKERQQEKQRRRVISFLNVVFGNTESTFRLWKNINTACKEEFGVTVWDNEFTDINVGYFLQALQQNLNIKLHEKVHQRKVFKSMNSFEETDFVRFQFRSMIYSLDFTNAFEHIQECIQESNFDSFHDLCEILTKETSNHVPFLQLIKKHPIHDKISEFLLNFTSPDESKQLYNRIEEHALPSRYVYESKLAQIKWYLKANRVESINKPVNFIFEHARQWLGDVHPIYTQVNRLLAQYFSEHQFYYQKALKYATASLNMQQALFGGDNQYVWKDYFLLGKIHFVNSHPEESLNYLAKAKQLVKSDQVQDVETYGELCLMLAKGYFSNKYYKQSYTIVKQLYHLIKEERDEKSLLFIVEAVALIKQLLEINQEHESYYRFVQSDFSHHVQAFAESPNLLIAAIKMITVPYLKNVILQKSKNRNRLLGIIEEISKITQSQNSSISYLKSKIVEGSFPKSYLHYLKDIDSVVDQVLNNQMLQRWKSFNKMSNNSLLDKIGSSQINRGFEFLANMTALFSLLGKEVLDELFIMEK